MTSTAKYIGNAAEFAAGLQPGLFAGQILGDEFVGALFQVRADFRGKNRR